MPPIEILCVHGVGHGDEDTAWQAQWTEAVVRGLSPSSASPVNIRFLEYDDLFEAADLDPGVVAEAFARLMASAVVHGLGDLIGLPRSRQLARGGIGEGVRWTAGMVAQWAAGEDLRSRLRRRLTRLISEQKPSIICAHSLGSLIAYDTFRRAPDLLADRTLITFGSQIGNPAVRSTFGGRIEPIPGVRHWFHLFNKEDAVLTASLSRLRADRFTEVETTFDIAGVLDHDGAAYLGHANTRARVWREIAGPTPSAKKVISATAGLKEVPRRRALLVGINEYPNPAERLQGCVNDVYLMSATLQELGFRAEDIRIVLDSRATCAAIRDRVEWLLDDAKEGDDRFLFYSGHGAQIPTYGIGDKVDGFDECLVPYDFDWTAERAFSDDQFFELYTQLPYGARFTAVFDCCHSGGLTREGGVRARGLMLPDDIRHRTMRWDARHELWVPRELPRASRDLVGDASRKEELLGAHRSTKKLGHGLAVWSPTWRAFDEARKAYGHHGPYMPLLMYACREEELAYEYQHGATPYGAFTWSMVAELRRAQRSRTGVTYEALVKRAAKSIAKLGYAQHPVIAGPMLRRRESLSRG